MRIVKHTPWVAAALFLLASTAVASSQLAGQETQPSLSNGALADWLSRTSIESGVDDELNEFHFSFESIQPVFQSADKTYTAFVQGRVAYQDEDVTTNAGLGFRYLTPDRDWLFGINAWYDRTYDLHHQRWGLGLEAIGPLITGRANYYDAMTGWRTASLTATQLVEERAVDGFDFELEAPLPYMPWARAAVGYAMWDMTESDDVEGVTAALRMDLTRWSRLEANYRREDDENILGASLRVRFGKPEGVEHAATERFFSETAFVARDVSRHTLDRVERHHDIKVERRVTTGGKGGIISVVRGR
jgi:hypothetical protein